MTGYAIERTAFGKPIAQFGQIQRYIANSFAKTEAMRSLIYGVADSRSILATFGATSFVGTINTTH